MIKSAEGTTQGDPLAMAWYSLCTTTLIDHLSSNFQQVKQVWLVDDSSAAGKIKDLKMWYEALVEEGEKIGYYVNRGKSWLIVKDEHLEEQATSVFGTSVNIKKEGK